MLGAGAVAITADSASIPASHKRDAEEFAKRCGFRHEYIETYEFDNPDYAKNDKNRCFHCKDELFTCLEEVGRDTSFCGLPDERESAARRGRATVEEAHSDCHSGRVCRVPTAM